MRQFLIVFTVILAFLAQVTFAQEKKEPAAKEKGMEKKAEAMEKKAEKKEMAMEGEMWTMPPSLENDPWMSWMVGEWEGTTESPMGTSKDWMKVEFSLDGQFVIAHLKSEMTSVNKEMAEKMGMTEEQMKEPYYGMGVFTIDPKTGESIDYWFDSMRGISTGKGKREGNVETTKWESPMGSEVRTLEKKGKNEMVMTFKASMHGMDQPMEGKTVMTRKTSM